MDKSEYGRKQGTPPSLTHSVTFDCEIKRGISCMALTNQSVIEISEQILIYSNTRVECKGVKHAHFFVQKE